MSEPSGLDQNEVLKKKGNVTKSGIGLQQWGDAPMGEGIGTASSGTAERAAKNTERQRAQKRDEE